MVLAVLVVQMQTAMDLLFQVGKLEIAEGFTCVSVFTKKSKGSKCLIRLAVVVCLQCGVQTNYLSNSKQLSNFT